MRLMESLLRIAQAHTRLMQRDVVSVVDAVMAIHLVAKHSNSLSVSLLGMANLFFSPLICPTITSLTFSLCVCDLRVRH